MEVPLVDTRRALMEGEAALPTVGEVLAGDRPSLPFFVTDGTGEEVGAISAFLTHLALCDMSPLTCRSYAHDLLRWWRLLTVLRVEWANPTTAEVAVLGRLAAGSPQRAAAAEVWTNASRGEPEDREGVPSGPVRAVHDQPQSGDAACLLRLPRPLRARGPAVNPVPVRAERRALLAHRSPIDAQAKVPRAPIRQKIATRMPRAIPDPLWEELFAAMTSHRDRAVLAFYVSSGARASELLALRMEHVDWAGQRIWVVSTWRCTSTRRDGQALASRCGGRSTGGRAR